VCLEDYLGWVGQASDCPGPAVHSAKNGQASALAEKLNFLSFRGALRAEESLFSWVSIKERFLASLGMTKRVGHSFRRLFSLSGVGDLHREKQTG
jgi:hypothetical protein